MLFAIGRNRVTPLVVALLLLFLFVSPASALATTQPHYAGETVHAGKSFTLR